MNDLWNGVFWDNLEVVENETTIRIGPKDSYNYKLTRAWFQRHTTKFMSGFWKKSDLWLNEGLDLRKSQHLRKTVVDARYNGNKLKIKVGRPSCRSRNVPRYVSNRIGLQSSYLNDFVITDFPKYPGINGELIFKAWHVLLDLADHMMRVARREPSFNHSSVQDWALEIKSEKIIRIVFESLSIDETISARVIEFLTYNPTPPQPKGQKGLWGAPLFKVPGRSTIALAWAVLKATNFLRTVEIWLEKGGVGKTVAEKGRGDEYENILRAKYITALQGNRTFYNSKCLHYGIKKDKNFPEQIDLLIKVGHTIIVGEVKCFLFPTDYHERFNFYQNLRAAAEQAVRKSEAVENHPNIITNSFNIPVQDLKKFRITPLVVVNQGFGSTLSIDGCQIIDADFLEMYFRSPFMEIGTINGQMKGRRTNRIIRLYKNEKDASDNILSNLKRPYVLTRYIDRFTWQETAGPPIGGKSIIIKKVELGEIGHLEGEYIQSLSRAL